VAGDRRDLRRQALAAHRPYWSTQETGVVRILNRSLRVPERWIARALLAVVLFLNVIIVWILKLANDWNARFYNALEQKNVDAFWGELRYFVVIATLFILVAVYRLWFRQMLQIRWRRWLTDTYYREWLRDRTYYRMELTRNGSDNPEQRIQEDCEAFTAQTLTIVLGLISELLTLITFTAILWHLSGSITLPVLGGIEIPGYMMWVAVIYAGLGSWLTFKIGRPLVRVNFELQSSNADFRTVDGPPPQSAGELCCFLFTRAGAADRNALDVLPRRGALWQRHREDAVLEPRQDLIG
jgi:putative ATP-binding cassette transporter